MNPSARTKIEIIANRLKEYDRKSSSIFPGSRKKDKKDYSFSIKVITEEGDNPLVICERATGYVNFNKFMDFALQKNPYQIIYDEFDGDAPESKKRKDMSVRINMSSEQLADDDADGGELSGIGDNDDEETAYEMTPLERRMEQMSHEPVEKMLTEREVKRMLRNQNNTSLGKLQEAMDAIEKQRHQIEIENMRNSHEWDKRRMREQIDTLNEKLSVLKSEKEALEKELSDLEAENEDLSARVKDFEEGGSVGRFASSAEKLLPVIGPALAGLFPGLKGLAGSPEGMQTGLQQSHNQSSQPRQEEIELVTELVSSLDDVALSGFMVIVSRIIADKSNINIIRDLLN